MTFHFYLFYTVYRDIMARRGEALYLGGVAHDLTFRHAQWSVLPSPRRRWTMLPPHSFPPCWGRIKTRFTSKIAPNVQMSLPCTLKSLHCELKSLNIIRFYLILIGFHSIHLKWMGSVIYIDRNIKYLQKDVKYTVIKFCRC